MLNIHFSVRVFALGDEKFCTEVNVEVGLCNVKGGLKQTRISLQKVRSATTKFVGSLGELMACDLYSSAFISALTALGQCVG